MFPETKSRENETNYFPRAVCYVAKKTHKIPKTIIFHE
jgi:hypothetical protein